MPDALTVRAANLSGINVLSLRAIIAARNSEGDRPTIFAGYDGAGRKCFGFTGFGVGRSFDCIDSRIAELAVLPYVSMGGSRFQSVDRASVMGIVRSDVSRLEITLVDGSRRELPLNRWRAFAYVSKTSQTLPKTLLAYAADGTVLEEVNASVGPLCGGDAGSCPKVP